MSDIIKSGIATVTMKSTQVKFEKVFVKLFSNNEVVVLTNEPISDDHKTTKLFTRTTDEIEIDWDVTAVKPIID